MDDLLNLFFGIHPFTVLRLATTLFALLLTFLIYILMGLTPMIPKRVFLPLTLFGVVAQLALFPFMIYCYDRLPLVTWGILLSQGGLGSGGSLLGKRRVQFRLATGRGKPAGSEKF